MTKPPAHRDLERTLWFVRRVLMDEIIRADTVADMERAANGIDAARRLGEAWEAERARHETPHLRVSAGQHET